MQIAIILYLGVLSTWLLGSRSEFDPTDTVPRELRDTIASHSLDDQLAAAIEQANPEDLIRVIAYLHPKVNLCAMNLDFMRTRAALSDRHERIVRELRQVAVETQAPLLEVLWALAADDDVRGIRTFWIVNAIAFQATPAGVREIAIQPDVQLIHIDFQLDLIDPIKRTNDAGGGGMRGGPEKGLEAVRAPECWEAGFDGTGVLTSTLDTGVDYTHDALNDRWRGHDDRYTSHPEWAWHDPIYDSEFPEDEDGHGTHTMGTVCGGEPGDTIGVAPGAQWITSSVVNQPDGEAFVSDALDAFEWLIDPDGDPSTYWDVPAVNSNSWSLAAGAGYPPCDESFWEALDACEAAGIVVLFSAGNAGPGRETLQTPMDRATTEYNSFAVGALNANQSDWPIANFSSRGPSHCTSDGGEAIKPEVAAPGVGVRSSLPGNQYGTSQGTSMAVPHVNGVATIMRQANPNLPVDELKQIIMETCRDLGDEGEDNAYGHGMIDAYAALQRAIESNGVQFRFPSGRPRNIDPAGGSRIRFEVVAGPNDVPVGGSGKLFVDVGDGFAEAAIEWLDTNLYEGVFPACACGTPVRYYVSVTGVSGELYTSPGGAPRNFSTAEPLNSSGVVFHESFDEVGGWTVKKENGVTGGVWQRGTPVNDPNWAYDPETDGDGSGQCWLTQNETGPTDVDGGGVLLLSPAFDLRDALSIRYSYYYNESIDRDGDDSLTVEISKTGEKESWKQIAQHPESNGLGWVQHEVSREQIEATGLRIGSRMYLRFTAADRGGSSVVEAGIDGFEIVEATCNERIRTGDMNCDGRIDFDDIDAFVTAITSQSEYEEQFPDCLFQNGDTNGDNVVGFDDIDSFVSCIVIGRC